jgi:hypothetical protein
MDCAESIAPLHCYHDQPANSSARLSAQRLLVRVSRAETQNWAVKILAEVTALANAVAAVALNQPIDEGGNDDGIFNCWKSLEDVRG